MYNAAVIGTGNIGFKFSLDSKREGTWSHVDAYMKCEKTNLSAVVEPDKTNRELFSEHFPEIPVYESVDEMLNQHLIDIISIAVPTKYHHNIYFEILKYPVKAVFCEKPLSYSPQESEEMVKASEEKNVILAVNYTRRWQNSYRLVKSLIEKGKIGTVTAVTGYYPENLFNVGSHLIDTINMLVPLEPEKISSFVLNNSEDPAYSGIILGEKKEVISVISTGSKEDLIFEIEITGRDGRIKIYENGEKIDCYLFRESERYSGYRELFKQNIEISEKNDRFLDAIYDIISVIEGKKTQAECSGRDALKTDIIISKIIDSAEKI